MTRKLIKFLFFFLLVTIIMIFYLSFFGIKTVKFNNKINSKISNINKKINLDLKSIKILLNPINLSINVIAFDPNIIFDENKLELESIKTNIDLKSFFNKDFLVKDLKIITKKIALVDLASFTMFLENTVKTMLFDKIIKNGTLKAEINFNFDKNGKIKDDYEINGSIEKGKIGILKGNSFEELNFIFNIKNQEYNLKNISVKVDQFELSSPNIKLKERNNHFLINGSLLSKKKDINFQKLSKLFKRNLNKYKIDNLKFGSQNTFNILIDKKLKIKDFILESEINLEKLIYKKNFLNFKKYLPNYNKMIELKNHKILINYKNNELRINGKGMFKINNEIDFLSYNILKKDKEYKFTSNINLNENFFVLDFLDYKKNSNLNASLKFNGVYTKENKINFSFISFIENNNNFLIENLQLSKKLKIINIKKVKLDYINHNNTINKISLIKYKKKYKIYGKSFDASKLIDELLNSTDNKKNKSIFKGINSTIVIDIEKVYLDNLTYVKSLKGQIQLKKNEIIKLDLDSFFSSSQHLKLTINKNKNNEKITTLFSHYPKPLIKKYKFIKGFEGGTLDFYSIKKNTISNSVLKIDNFKVKEVPVLAKLLTLASLQGISDLLTGEGIRFTDFEMKFTNKKNLMTIQEMYAIGPAISILMDGYIQNKELISLRGTLVPATTINRSIASIPLIGNILIGKKTGEGVFGVSFKIKGPPKNLKTTVNPVKTLTPRFITRTLEKLKKN